MKPIQNKNFKTLFRRENGSLKAENDCITLKNQEERDHHKKELELNQHKNGEDLKEIKSNHQEEIDELEERIEELEEELE